MAKVSSHQVIDGLKHQGIHNLEDLAAFVEKKTGETGEGLVVVFGGAGKTLTVGGKSVTLEACPLSPR